MRRHPTRTSTGRRRPTAPLLGSPLGDGLAALAVIVAAIALTWKVDQGLPFVPTYQLNALLPGGANLRAAGEVRSGGFRVGTVDALEPRVIETDSGPLAVALVRMRLDSLVARLPRDTTVVVRPRTAGGLKYLELTPGSSRHVFAAGETIPLANSEAPIEVDDMLALYDEPTRTDMTAALEGVGTTLASRGPSLNDGLFELRTVTRHLGPVMQSLSRPSTGLAPTLREGAAIVAGVAPVSAVAADSFTAMADTFAAAGRHPPALRATLTDAAPTARASSASFAEQRPLLEDAAALAVAAQPAVEELPRSLPVLSSALVAGRDPLVRAPALARSAGEALRALRRLVANPNTGLALRDAKQAGANGAPLIEYLAPYQTVCNYAVLTFTNFGDIASEPVDAGTVSRGLLKFGNQTQDDRLSDSNADRPADVPADMDTQNAQAEDLDDFEDARERADDALAGAEDALDRVRALGVGDALPDGLELPGGLEDIVGPTIDDAAEIGVLHRALDEQVDRRRERLDALDAAGELDLTSYRHQPYQPAIDGRGNADCQSGQNGFPDRLVTTGRHAPSDNPEKNGGSHVVMDANTPGLAGPTYTGVQRLQHVDEAQRSRHPRGEVPER